MSEVTITKSDYIGFVEGLHYENGAIAIDQETIDGVQDCSLVIFRNVFSPEFLTDLRKAVVFHDYKAEDYAVDENGLLLNYKRWDDLLHRPRRACKNMGYNLYPWNKETPDVIETVRVAVTRFANLLAGRDPEARISLDADKIGTVTFAYYPPGGCLMSHHFSDDIVGERTEVFDEIIVPFATYGVDYHDGGLYVAPRYRITETDDPSNYGDLRFMENDIGAGDLVAFTIKDCYHRVEPIDPELEGRPDVPFDPMKNRFLMAFYYGELSVFQKLAAMAGSEKQAAKEQ